MVGQEQATLHRDVTRISEDYFGPVASRFINRIIANHLNIKPEKITAQDLPKLITWIQLSMAMVTDDTDIISEYIDRLHGLAKE